jgi:hypothetical protein
MSEKKEASALKDVWLTRYERMAIFAWLQNTKERDYPTLNRIDQAKRALRIKGLEKKYKDGTTGRILIKPEEGNVYTKMTFQQANLTDIVSWLTDHKKYDGADSTNIVSATERLRDAKSRTVKETVHPIIEPEENEDDLETMGEAEGGNGEIETSIRESDKAELRDIKAEIDAAAESFKKMTAEPIQE